MSKKCVDNTKKNEDNVIDTNDWRNKRIIFTYKQWNKKSKKHTWLKNEVFLSYVRKALANPTEVWEDYDRPKNKWCYYYKYGVGLHAKVVVWIRPGDAHIITAYDCHGLYFVKESKYPNLRRIYEK